MTRIFAALAWSLWGCSSGGGRPPTARIALTPAYVPLGDNFATAVALDGSGSSDTIDDPLAANPLAFHWTADDPNARFEPDATSAKATVRIAGANPVTLRLVVDDLGGDEGATAAILGVTVP